MVQEQARGFSVARTKVGTNNPMRCTAAAVTAVDGDLCFSNLCASTAMVYVHGVGRTDIQVIFSLQAMHGPAAISERCMEH